MKDKISKIGCVYCTGKSVQGIFVPPEIPNNPNLVIIGESPDETEKLTGKPFQGESGQILRGLLDKVGARAIIVNARNCYHEGKPTTLEIKGSREKHLEPILKQYPTLPVVALGEYAAQAILGGPKRKESMANESRIVDGHLVAFGYHPAHYLWSGRAEWILEQIEVTLRSALYKPTEAAYRRSGKHPSTSTEIVLDIETDSLEYPWIGGKPLRIGVMPLGHTSRLYTPEEFFALKDFWNTQIRLVVGHGMTFDLVYLAAGGVTFDKAQFWDTLSYERNTNTTEQWYGLKWLARKYFKFPFWEAPITTYLKDHRNSLAGITDEILDSYNATDLYANEQLYLKQKAQELSYPPFQMDMDYLKYIRTMAANGFYVDKNKLIKIGKDISTELVSLVTSTKKKFHLGKDFNFNSPQQVLGVLQNEGYKIEGTDKETLVPLNVPLGNSILRIRELNKIYSTNVDGMIPLIDNKGLIHSHFGRTETFRLTSSNPNLENLPPIIRPAFTSRFSGGRLLKSDLSGLEYRIIAHLSREPKLLEAFARNEDIHVNMVKFLFNKEPKNEKERKDLGKTPNYATVYQAGYTKFRYLTRLPDSAETRNLYRRVQGAYPEVNNWRGYVEEELRRTGCVSNLFGRRRCFNRPISFADEREAVNWIVQSSGHDILEIYLMEVADQPQMVYWGRRGKILLANEVHDDFTFDAAKEAHKDGMEAIKSVSQPNLNGLILSVFGISMLAPITTEDKVLKEWK